MHRITPSGLFGLCLGFLAVYGSARGEPTFPYKAYISANDVYVRSGPGQSYYPTEKLQAGDQVEVYRHDPGGWYAIRPPKGSFSWVSGRYLTPGKDNLAVVTRDQLAARVGSRFSDIRDVIQVRLHKGEVVEVLEAQPSPDASTTWYKIAPPSGEFRWIFGKYVDPHDPHNGLRRTHAASRHRQESSSRATVSSVSLVGARDSEAAAEAPEDQTGADHFEPSTGEEAQQPAEKSSEGVSPGRIAWQAADPQPSQLRDETQPVLSPAQFQAALEELDLRLSAMVAEEPTVWSFDQMRQQTRTLLAEAETAVERGRARVLLKKMDRFEEIKQRYDEIHQARTHYERSTRNFATLARQDRPSLEDHALEGRFDGVGQLTRVVSPKLGAPRYALLDRTGAVRCYVTPAPGVPLRYYVGREVGVSGTRGYMPEQQAPHIMAQHVSPLDTSLR